MFFIAASAMFLIPVAADDQRLLGKDTYVSEAAQIALDAKDDERVLCLDRMVKRELTHICLTESQWNEAIRSAESINRRERLINLSRFYAGQNGFN